jgi:hypothetical protein
MRGFHNLFREKPFLFMLSGWSTVSIAHLNYMFHASGFHGQDTGVMKLDVVTHVYTEMSCG